MLDLEWQNGSSCRPNKDRYETLVKVRTMLEAMERHTGKLPIIYTDINFHRDILVGEPFLNTFWLRATAAPPEARYSNRMWTFWRWTQTGVVAGVRGEVDRNAFFGNASDWDIFLRTVALPARWQPLPRMVVAHGRGDSPGAVGKNTRRACRNPIIVDPTWTRPSSTRRSARGPSRFVVDLASSS